MKYIAKLQLHFNKIRKAQLKAQGRILKRYGAYVRKIARDFIRHKRNPDVHSRPFSSPYDHYGLRNSIVFDTDGQYAYIGPRHIRGGLNNVARLHEFGGEALVRNVDPDLWKGVNIGMVAPVTVKNLRRGDSVVREDTRLDPKTGRRVVWIRIATRTQARHSTRLYHRLMANAGNKLVRYAPRPYMHPALLKALPHLSPMWRNALRE